jgi:hypothetical protein
MGKRSSNCPLDLVGGTPHGSSIRAIADENRERTS